MGFHHFRRSYIPIPRNTSGVWRACAHVNRRAISLSVGVSVGERPHEGSYTGKLNGFCQRIALRSANATESGTPGDGTSATVCHLNSCGAIMPFDLTSGCRKMRACNTASLLEPRSRRKLLGLRYMRFAGRDWVPE